MSLDPLGSVRSLLVHLALALALAPALFANDYFVDGRTGQDVATAGSSISTPWRTIGYALSQIPRPTNPQASHRLFVAGDQVYGVSTNGESFPIRPAFNVSIEGRRGAGGLLPVLEIPAGAIGLLFDPMEVYNRNQVTIGNLVFRGGAYAARLGGNMGVRHRPRFSSCSFLDQTEAGADLVMRGRAIQDPRFVACLFDGGVDGIRGDAVGPDAVLFPDVEECSFINLAGTGVALRDSTLSSSNVGATIRSCVFRMSGRGVLILSGRNAQNTNAVVRDSSFRDLRGEGVHLVIEQPGDPALTVEDCTFSRVGFGVRMEGVLTPGPYSLDLTRNVAVGPGIGAFVVGPLRGTGGSVRIRRDGNLATGGFLSGFATNVESSDIVCVSVAEGDRSLDNGVGELIRGAGNQTRVVVQSAILAGNAREGLVAQGAADITARWLTIADNGTGLEADSGGPRQFDHLLLAGNATPVNAAPSTAITYSFFEGGAFPGTGNLTGDPRLLRPSYKLAPTSPCIDAGNLAALGPNTDYEGDPRNGVGRVGGQPVPDIGADEYMLRGSAHAFGAGGTGIGNVFPRFGPTTGQTVPGTACTLALTGATDLFGNDALGAALVAGPETMPPTQLTRSGLAGLFLVQPLVTAPAMVAPGGTAVLSIPIPSDPTLVGESLGFQWAIAHPRAGIVLSDGLRLTVGS